MRHYKRVTKVKHSLFSGIELTIRDFDMMEDVADDWNNKRDNKKKRDKKRSHKEHEKEDFAKESFKKMKKEIEEMRQRENERTKELEDLRKKINDQQKQSGTFQQTEYTLDFEKEKYLNKGFIESAKWIKDVLAQNMMEKMEKEENVSKFNVLMIAKKNSKHLGVRTCARFNRGEICTRGKWHSTHATPKPEALWTRHRQGINQSEQREISRTVDHGRSNEVRLHACTLCIEALGAAYGHGVLDCPWIKEDSWK